MTLKATASDSILFDAGWAYLWLAGADIHELTRKGGYDRVPAGRLSLSLSGSTLEVSLELSLEARQDRRRASISPPRSSQE